jgi:hypothetical protein
MANLGIVANQIGFLPLTLTVNGAVVPTPPADAFSVVSSAPTKMGMTIGVDPSGATTDTGVIITCLVTESDPGNGGGGFTGLVTDSNGDLALTTDPFDITLVPVVPSIAAGAMRFSANPTPPTAAGP